MMFDFEEEEEKKKLSVNRITYKTETKTNHKHTELSPIKVIRILNIPFVFCARIPKMDAIVRIILS